MKKLPGLTLASLLAACASEAPLPVASDVQAIVDGDDASAASFNMVARLERQLGWEDACSGVVLRNDVAEGVCYVLTVRHCVPTLAQERCKDAPRIARFSGTSTPWLWPAAPVGTVHSFLTSPDGEDLAMVKVNCSAFTPAIKGTAVPVTGEIGTIVGWGRTNGDVLPTKRRKAQVQLTPQPDGTVGFVGLDGSPDNGDSGGAIFVNRNGELRLAAIITTSVVLGLFGEGQIVPLGPPFAPGWIDQFMDRGGVHPDAMERCGFHPSGFTNLAEERLRSDCDKRYRENYCPASQCVRRGGNTLDYCAERYKRLSCGGMGYTVRQEIECCAGQLYDASFSGPKECLTCKDGQHFVKTGSSKCLPCGGRETSADKTDDCCATGYVGGTMNEYPYDTTVKQCVSCTSRDGETTYQSIQLLSYQCPY